MLKQVVLLVELVGFGATALAGLVAWGQLLQGTFQNL